jgi:hypothetical protein
VMDLLCATCGRVPDPPDHVGPVKWWFTEYECGHCHTKWIQARDDAYSAAMKKLTLEEIRALGLVIR